MKFDAFQIEGKAPWKIVLRGAAIPGIIVAVCSLIGLLNAQINGGDIKQMAKIGAGVGLFFSLWGGIEIMAAIFGATQNTRTALLILLGYAIVWAICLFLIFQGLS